MFILAFIGLLLLPVRPDRWDGFVSGPGPNLDPGVPIRSASMDRLIAFFDRPMKPTGRYGNRET